MHLSQSGLGLPDESYYREDAYAEIREKYLAHLAKLAALVGLPEPERLAETVLELETALAARSWDRVTNRDAEKTYTLMTGAALRQHAPTFDWDAWQAGLGAPAGAFDEVIVRQPSFVAAAAELWAERPLEQWQAWLAVRTASAFAEYLNTAVVEEDFDFYGRTLSGTPQLRERWKRGVSLVEGALGEAVGRLYVERHFPASSKERMVTLVANLVEAYRQQHQRAGLDEPADPRAGAGTSWPGSPRRSATRTAGRTTRPCGSSPTTCSATCSARQPGPPTTSSPRSARRSTAASG